MDARRSILRASSFPAIAIILTAFCLVLLGAENGLAASLSEYTDQTSSQTSGLTLFTVDEIAADGVVGTTDPQPATGPVGTDPAGTGLAGTDSVVPDATSGSDPAVTARSDSTGDPSTVFDAASNSASPPVEAIIVEPGPAAGADQNGDGRNELAVFYDYSNANTGLLIFNPDGSGYANPGMVWASGAGNWDWFRSKTAVVDSDGDGSTELAILYNYGNSNTGLFIFNPAMGYAPQRVWLSGAGNWDWYRSKIAALDRNGSGVIDLAILYNYGNSNTGLFLFDSAAGYAPQRVWLSGAGNWDWCRSMITTTDRDGDSTGELAVLYDYGNANTGLFILDPVQNFTPERVWLSGAGNWESWRSKLTAMDVDNDGKTELAVFYDYDGGNTGLHIFDPDEWNAPGYTPPREWLSGWGNWGWGCSRVTAVDPDGDGKAGLAVLYDYGNSNTGLFVFNPESWNSPQRVWLSGAGNWGWTRSKAVNADSYDGAAPASFDGLRRMIDWLNAQVGKPYIWGGGHPPNAYLSGYDCSGLVSTALQVGGFQMDGTTYMLVDQVYFISECAACQTALVLGFVEDISHVGISIMGQWWEATTPAVLGPAQASRTWDFYAVPAIVSGGLFKLGRFRRIFLQRSRRRRR